MVALGGLIYSFGGNSGASPITNAYVYNPANNVWSAIASLPAARVGASAVSDGTYIYIVNGSAPGGILSNTLYRYNPATNNYTTLAAAPNVSSFHAAVYLGGKIYRVSGNGPGGVRTSSVDVYDIAANTWSPTGSIANYPAAVVEHALVSDGTYLYGAGGFDGANIVSKTYRYDPVGNTWSDAAITDLPQGRYTAAYALLNGHERSGGRAGRGQLVNDP